MGDDRRTKTAVEDKYFTPSEVEAHNAPDDCWVSWLGHVYNLSSLVEAHRSHPLVAPILKNAGRDISHWFNSADGELKSHINPLTECKTPYTPEGPFLHVLPPLPNSRWFTDPATANIKPWWQNRDAYCVGKLSQKTRRLRIINTLTRDEHCLEVAPEEKLSAIQDRYLLYNSHAKGYMWKRLGQLLDMSRTLEENGVKEESHQFEQVGMDEEDWLPAVHLYFSDDLTIA
ncbi:hypothetical protein DFS34DRAFT_647764 [Phlyctochytrium arcticum]|nr:hypothetical protein DFS34DRAFT_647764 [Phlyctochytrium arcticum]